MDLTYLLCLKEYLVFAWLYSDGFQMKTIRSLYVICWVMVTMMMWTFIVQLQQKVDFLFGHVLHSLEEEYGIDHCLVSSVVEPLTSILYTVKEAQPYHASKPHNVSCTANLLSGCSREDLCKSLRIG